MVLIKVSFKMDIKTHYGSKIVEDLKVETEICEKCFRCSPMDWLDNIKMTLEDYTSDKQKLETITNLINDVNVSEEQDDSFWSDGGDYHTATLHTHGDFNPTQIYIEYATAFGKSWDITVPYKLRLDKPTYAPFDCYEIL